MVASKGIASEFELSTAPTGPVVPACDLRRYVDLYDNEDDSFLAELEKMAVERIESDTRRQLVTATWKLYLSCFPSVIQIRKAPVASVTQIRYVDTDGDWQILSPSVYETFLQREPAEIRLAYQQTWPVVRQKEQAVEVTFTAGYGTADDVPEIAKHAVKMIVQDAYNNCDGNSHAVESLLSRLNWGF